MHNIVATNSSSEPIGGEVVSCVKVLSPKLDLRVNSVQDPLWRSVVLGGDFRDCRQTRSAVRHRQGPRDVTSQGHLSKGQRWCSGKKDVPSSNPSTQLRESCSRVRPKYISSSKTIEPAPALIRRERS